MRREQRTDRVIGPGSGVLQPGSLPGAVAPGGAVGVVDGFGVWLAGVDIGSLSDRERVDLVAALERVKGAASAGQARATDALRCSREAVAPRDVARSVGSMVALARRESPTLGDRFVGLSRALVHEMPCTMAALTAGEVGERVAVAVVAATATLCLADRAEVDSRLGPVIGRLGVKAAGAAAARVAAELDAASVVARLEAAAKSRRVTVRPAPDGMAYLSVLGPLKDVVGAHAALQARSRSVVGGQCPDEAPAGRGVGAVAADTALRVLSGRGMGELTPLEVHLVITDRALLGTGDPDRGVFEPARIPGHGSVPAPVARAWLREGVDDTDDHDTADCEDESAGRHEPQDQGSCTATGTTISRTGSTAIESTGTKEGTGTSEGTGIGTSSGASGDATGGATGGENASDTPDRPEQLSLVDELAAGAPGARHSRAATTVPATGSGTGSGGGAAAQTTQQRAARVWLRRLYTSPDGRDLVGMDSTRRRFTGMLRRMLVLRDDLCATPWCEAPIAHADHTIPVHQHGRTTFDDGSGKCARCNYAKEAPGWRARVLLPGDLQGGAAEGQATATASPDSVDRRVVQITTPLGHQYSSEPPPLLGWGSASPRRSLTPLRGIADTATPDATGPTREPMQPEPERQLRPEVLVAVRAEPAPRAEWSRAPEPGFPTRAEAVGPRDPAHRRKRSLRRERAAQRPLVRRRPRLTSHLERRLCRYLT